MTSQAKDEIDADRTLSHAPSVVSLQPKATTTNEEADDEDEMNSLQEHQFIKLSAEHEHRVRVCERKADALQLENHILKGRLLSQQQVIAELNRQLLCKSTASPSSRVPSSSSLPTRSLSHSCVPVAVSSSLNTRRQHSNSITATTVSHSRSNVAVRNTSVTKLGSKDTKSSSPLDKENTLTAADQQHVHCSLLRNAFTDLALLVLQEMQECEWIGDSKSEDQTIPDHLQADVRLLQEALADGNHKPITQPYLLPGLCVSSLTCLRAAFHQRHLQTRQLQQQVAASQTECDMYRRLMNKMSDERRRIVRVHTKVTKEVRQLRLCSNGKDNGVEDGGQRTKETKEGEQESGVNSLGHQPIELNRQTREQLNRVQHCLEQQIESLANESEALQRLCQEFQGQRGLLERQLNERNEQLQTQQVKVLDLENQLERAKQAKSQSDQQTEQQIEEIRVRLQATQKRLVESERHFDQTNAELSKTRQALQSIRNEMQMCKRTAHERSVRLQHLHRLLRAFSSMLLMPSQEATDVGETDRLMKLFRKLSEELRAYGRKAAAASESAFDSVVIHESSDVEMSDVISTPDSAEASVMSVAGQLAECVEWMQRLIHSKANSDRMIERLQQQLNESAQQQSRCQQQLQKQLTEQSVASDRVQQQVKRLHDERNAMALTLQQIELESERVHRFVQQSIDTVNKKSVDGCTTGSTRYESERTSVQESIREHSHGGQIVRLHQIQSDESVRGGPGSVAVQRLQSCEQSLLELQRLIRELIQRSDRLRSSAEHHAGRLKQIQENVIDTRNSSAELEQQMQMLRKQVLDLRTARGDLQQTLQSQR